MTITFVYGKLCSGKGHYCKKQANSSTDIIITSDIVKNISGEAHRSKLSKTAHFADRIADIIIAKIYSSLQNQKAVIIDGVRQKIIVDRILSYFKGIETKHIWLEVPEEELRLRFNNRLDKKDDHTFEQANKADTELGLDELKEWLTTNNILTIINHY